MNDKHAGTWPVFDEEEIDAVAAVLRSGKVNYRVGEEGKAFEREWAHAFDVPHAFAVANGTLALELMLRALPLTPGDEVIVPSRSFIATASAVIMAGGHVRFADVDAITGNLTARSVSACLSQRTRAMIAVHVGGWPCELNALEALAEDAGIALLEDCAQAHGARYHQRPVGTFGVASAFSFCQEKIISTGGEGGMIMCRDEAMAHRIARLRDHGKAPSPSSQGGSQGWRARTDGTGRAPVYRYVHEQLGSNARLTEMQSALGRIGLRRLPARIAARARAAAQLQAALEPQDVFRAPVVSEHLQPAWYRYYCQVEPQALAAGWDRDRVLLALSDAGVPAGSGACPLLQREQAFAGHLHPEDPPVPMAQRLGERSVALAIHHAMTARQVDQIDAALRQVASRARRGTP